MSKGQLVHEQVTGSVIRAFYDVYNALGFGFLESIYAAAMERELLERGHRVAREMNVRVMYKQQEIGTQRLDMVIDDKVIVEIKATLDLHKAANRQIYSYLRATNLEVGLLLHFGPEATFYRHTCRSGDSKDPYDLQRSI